MGLGPYWCVRNYHKAHNTFKNESNKNGEKKIRHIKDLTSITLSTWDDLVFDHTTAKRQELRDKHLESLKTLIDSIDLPVFLYGCQETTSSYMLYDDFNVDCLIVITKQAKEVLVLCNAIELDFSWYLVSPWTYCIPHRIINNASLPLGLILAPQETSYAVELFY